MGLLTGLGRGLAIGAIGAVKSLANLDLRSADNKLDESISNNEKKINDLYNNLLVELESCTTLEEIINLAKIASEKSSSFYYEHILKTQYFAHDEFQISFMNIDKYVDLYVKRKEDMVDDDTKKIILAEIEHEYGTDLRDKIVEYVKNNINKGKADYSYKIKKYESREDVLTLGGLAKRVDETYNKPEQKEIEIDTIDYTVKMSMRIFRKKIDAIA